MEFNLQELNCAEADEKPKNKRNSIKFNNLSTYKINTILAVPVRMNKKKNSKFKMTLKLQFIATISIEPKYDDKQKEYMQMEGGWSEKFKLRNSYLFCLN